ncbi:MAG: DUF975 family protein [Lachnospiraceae bacterium]|nr:DUF975 family protein [Lachnospiraceae bacterium]
MWDRKELKMNAKSLMKVSYWKAVVAGLVLAVCAGNGAGAGRDNSTTDSSTIFEQFTELDPAIILAALFAVLFVSVWAIAFGVVISAFVKNPLEVGAQKLFLNCRDNTAEFVDIVFAFKNSYFNIVKTLFLRGLFTGLWSLLFVIPGIVKAYEYRMIPYILAEHPEMSSKEAFARSKEMMDGNKWNAFVLDLSFIGWHILGVCTCGIAEIFYIMPYQCLTDAELYHELNK